jgi:very-short-patch-repair endonuclease
MRFIKRGIADRKEWLSITKKMPTEEVCVLWDTTKTMKPCDIKFLANLVEFDVPDITQRYNYYKALPANMAKGNTLELYKLKYGDVIGPQRYVRKCDSSINTKKRFIERHGEIDGRVKYDNYIDGMKNPKTRMVNKYGQTEGVKRYEKFCTRNKGNFSLERQIEIHGEKEGMKKFKAIRQRLSSIHSLESYKKRHGDILGTDLYMSKMAKMWKSSKLGYSSISQVLFKKVSEQVPDRLLLYNDNNGEYIVGKYSLDFYDVSTKRAIEFNGDRFHANPSIYSPEDTPNPFNTDLTSLMIWEYDKARLRYLNDAGISVLVIWEKDFRNDEQRIIDQCITFLKMK